jgi:uncharacterized membrane protein YdbT with pleckstrin-like domain
MRCKSAVDLWITILFIITLSVIYISLFMVPGEEIFAGLAVALSVTAFLLWIYFGTYYELRDEYLYCRSGPFFEKIPYDRIKSIRPCRNMLSSMALSLNRLEIRQHGRGYITGTTLISPVNPEEFMKLLKERCRHIEPDKNQI